MMSSHSESYTKSECNEKKHPSITVNLLNPGPMGELGKAVYELLLDEDSRCVSLRTKHGKIVHRHIEVNGS